MNKRNNDCVFLLDPDWRWKFHGTSDDYCSRIQISIVRKITFARILKIRWKELAHFSSVVLLERPPKIELGSELRTFGTSEGLICQQ